MSTTAVFNRLNSSYQSDLSTAGNIGQAMEKANKNLSKAISGGKTDEIMQAELERSKIERAFAIFTATKKKEHDLIMELIRMIAR